MYEYKCLEVLSVYDGDTCTLLLDLGFGIHSVQTIRLYGIDTPELRGETIVEGRKAKIFLVEKLKSSDSIIVKTYQDKTEKYGRLLGEIFIEDEETSVNQMLIQEGYAKDYFGGTKV